MAKFLKNNLRNFLLLCLIFLLVTGWFFSGWPRIKEAEAQEDRQNYYAESTAESSWNTDTTYQDKTTLTFTPDDSSTYVIIASWLMQESSTSYQVKAKLTRTTGTAKDFNELIYQPKDATDYISGGAIGIDTFGASPGSQTYKIQYTTNSSSGTARIKEAKIIAIKLTSADQYAQSEDRITTTQTAYQDKTTLTFAPATAGDYIIIASATGDGASASYDFRIQLTIDGTAYSNYNIEPAYATNRYLWGMVKRVELTAASHTVKIQYSAESATAGREAGIAHARIVALRADEFNNNYYAESEARVTYSADANYQDKTTLTQTPQAADHLIIGSAGLDGASASVSAYGQLIKDATSYGEMLVETKDTSNRGYPYFGIKKETLSAVSTTWKMQYKTETAGTAAGIKDARIAVLELRTPSVPTGPTVDAVTFGPDSVTPQVEQTVTVAVSDADGKADLATLVLKVYYDSDGGTPTDAEAEAQTADTQNCAIITWTQSTDIFAIEPSASTTWSLGTCSSPASLPGDFTFKFTSGKVATETTGSALWQIWAKVTDDASQTDTNYDTTPPTMQWYGEIDVTTVEVNFDTIELGSDFATNNVTDISVTYIANGAYNEQVKASSLWGAAPNQVTLNATEEPGDGEFSLKANDDATLGEAVLVSSADYTTFDSGTQTGESGNVESANTLWLSLGLGIPVDTYSGTIYFGIAL
jgi:hypothetical protein